MRFGLQAPELFVKCVPAHLGYSHGYVCEATICGANLSQYAIDLRHSGCYNATLTLASLTAHFSKKKRVAFFTFRNQPLVYNWSSIDSCFVNYILFETKIGLHFSTFGKQRIGVIGVPLDSVRYRWVFLFFVSNVCVIVCLSVFHINLVATYTQK